jgi:hypothetical protein
MKRDPECRATADMALHLPLGVSWLGAQPDLVVARQPAELDAMGKMKRAGKGPMLCWVLRCEGTG